VVATLLGTAPEESVLRPTDSALDEDSIDAVAARGVDLLLLDDTTVPPPEQDRGFSPPPTTLVAGRDAELPAVVGDQSVRLLLTDAATDAFGDPVRAAQAVLGELATIWLEQPSVERGVSVIFDESTPLPGSFFPALAHGLAERPPWLDSRTASGLAASFPPTERAETFIQSEDVFSQPYAGSIKGARRRIDTLRAMLVDPSDVPGRFETLLLLAESGDFVGNETAGRAYIDRVDDSVVGVFEDVYALPNQIFTLTASSAEVPVQVSNDADFPVRVVVDLSSPSIRPTPQQTVVLAPDTSPTLTFDIELRQTGRRDVEVSILSPSQRRIGSPVKLYVQSTAYNRVALWITVGAAALAFAVWARRFVPRRVA
jgi:hypothetical protein